MFVLFLTVFLSMSSFALLLPSVLFALQNLGVATSLSTVALGLYSAFSFIMGPILGRLSDRLGRKRILTFSLLVASLAYSLMSYMSHNAHMIFLTFALAGAMAGNMAVVFAAVADRTDETNRAKGMGLVGAAIGLAFTVGPFVGGLVAGRDADTASLLVPASISAVLCFTGLLLVLTLFRDKFSPSTKTLAASADDTRRISGLLSFLRKYHGDGFLLPLVVMLVFTLSLALMEPSLPLLMRDRFLSGPREVGQVFLVVGFTLIIVQGGLISPLTRRFGEFVLARVGMVMLAGGLVLIVSASAMIAIYVGALLTAAGAALNNTSLASIVSRRSQVGQVGKSMGAFHAMQSLGRALGPFIAGVLYEFRQGLPFGLGAVLVIVCLVLFFREKEVAAVQSD